MRYLNKRDIEVYQAITDCLAECKSIEHFKMLLDLHKISYPKTSDLDFAVWMYHQSESYPRFKLANAEIKWNGETWTPRNLFSHLASIRWKMIYKAGGNDPQHLVNAPRCILMAWCRKNIDQIVSRDLAMHWLVTKLTMKSGKNSIFGSLKDTLLYYWMKKHHLEIGKLQRIASK